MQTKIELIFPTPIMFVELGRDFTKEELDFVKKHSHLTYANVGNATSNNNYILHEPEFESLNQFITEAINEYSNKIHKPKYKNEIYITQSWLNFASKGQFHHEHNHLNSFISGVLYIQTDATNDKITFHKSGYSQLFLATDTYDALNSDSWWFSVKTGAIVLFPSSLTHSVESVTSDETRISLGFNTFVKGTLGEKNKLTECING
jgi:uncharacterized protein (TIGR02466 family)